MTSNQLAATLANRERTARHEERMAEDLAYRAKAEAEAAEYAAFCATYGEPDRGI
jgi:hypothetical protein